MGVNVIDPHQNWIQSVGIAHREFLYNIYTSTLYTYSTISSLGQQLISLPQVHIYGYRCVMVVYAGVVMEGGGFPGGFPFNHRTCTLVATHSIFHNSVGTSSFTLVANSFDVCSAGNYD